MYFVLHEAHPKPSHPDYGRIDGAFVSAFVNDFSAEAAKATAREWIEESGWDVRTLDEFYPVERERYEPGTESLADFDQALLDGIVLRFHTWPVGAPDNAE